MTHEARWPVVVMILLTLSGCASQPQPAAEEEKPATLDGEAVVNLNNRALTLKEKSQFREAADLLRSGIRSAPETPELHYNLAVISELYLFDLTAALEHYRHYRELTGKDDKLVAGWIADLERRLQ